MPGDDDIKKLLLKKISFQKVRQYIYIDNWKRTSSVKGLTFFPPLKTWEILVHFCAWPVCQSSQFLALLHAFPFCPLPGAATCSEWFRHFTWGRGRELSNCIGWSLSHLFLHLPLLSRSAVREQLGASSLTQHGNPPPGVIPLRGKAVACYG